jgi:hypothetical protein
MTKIRARSPLTFGNRIMCPVDASNVTFVKGDLHMVPTTRRKVNGGRDLPGQSVPSKEIW